MNAVAQVKIQRVECEKCREQWIPRSDSLPAVCANRKCKARGRVRWVVDDDKSPSAG